MRSRDFEGLKFSAWEVIGTGAEIKDVKFYAMKSLHNMRVELDRAVALLDNGLTTGRHRSASHPDGTAFDWRFSSRPNICNVSRVVKAALNAGFHEIGVYWNGTQYSFHVAIRKDKKFKFWTATKVKHSLRVTKADHRWKFSGMIFDPKRQAA